MSLLPANPTSRRREEAIREAARTEAIDRVRAMEAKIDAQLASQARLGMKDYTEGVASATSTPTPEAQAIQSLALAIGQDRILLPEAIIINRRLTEDGDEIATSIRVGHLTLTIAEAVRLGVLDLDGRFSHYRAGNLLHAIPQQGTWVRPHQAAAAPGRPR